MDSISKALVIAIHYLGTERNDEEYTEDDDLKIVEQAASIIQGASTQEKQSLIEAAKELGLRNWINDTGIE